MLIVEHTEDGTARYIILDQEPVDPSTLYRQIPIVEKHVQSLGSCRWGVQPVACLDCGDSGRSWISVAPENTSMLTLECLRCGARNSAKIEESWCSSCGYEVMVAREHGCKQEGLECSNCGNQSVMVDQA